MMFIGDRLKTATLLACLALLAACDRSGEAEPGGERNASVPPGEVSHDALVEKDGIFFKPGDAEPYTGVAVTRFKDGEIGLSSPYVDGRLHGMEEQWLKGGTKKRETSYREGEAWFVKLWRGDGSRKIESEMKGEHSHGHHKRFHPNGQLAFAGGFHEGKFDGLVEEFDEEGELVRRARYDKGTLVEELVSKEEDPGPEGE